jgi:hypothetical protein
MPDLSSPLNGPSRPADIPTLAERVLARVNEAGLSVDRRSRSVKRASSRHLTPVVDPLAAEVTRTPEQVREARSLRRVFGDLGDSYRRYRRETGAPVAPEIRDAAYRFRRELNVASLVSVAATLDAIDILTW